MAKIAENYEIGDRENITIERLLVIIENLYKDLAVAINMKPDIYQRTTDGLTTDVLLSNGDININNDTNSVQMLTNHDSTTSVIWTQLS